MQTFHNLKTRNTGQLFIMGLLSALILFVSNPAMAQPSYCNPCLFYGGDLNSTNPNRLINTNTTTFLAPPGDPYFAAIYVPFTVPAGQVWEVTGLFGNNQSQNGVIDPMDAFWTINTGMNTNTGGIVIDSGTDAATISPTGRIDNGLTEYTVSVTGLSGIPLLTPGAYWFAVVPYCTNGANASCNNGKSFFLSNTDRANAFGPPEPLNQSFLDSSSLGFPFLPTTIFGAEFTAFSAGLIGNSVELLSKSFTPNTINLGSESLITITLSFPGGASLNQDFIDTLPTNLSFTGTNIATTTCGGTVTNDSSSVTLTAGTIPASGSCTIKAKVKSSIPGTYANTIPADTLVVQQGANPPVSNAEVTAFLLVSRLCP